MVSRSLLVASAIGAVLIASQAIAQSGDQRASPMSRDASSDAPEMPQAKGPSAAPAPVAPRPAAPTPAPAPAPATVTVGPHTKPAVARILSSEAGDRGCYLRIADDRGVTSQELADFELCERKPPLKGQRVALTWRMERVMAASCQGDTNCKQTDQVPLIVSARPAN